MMPRSRSLSYIDPNARDIFLGEEDRSERIVNYVRLIVSLVFFCILIGIYDQIPVVSRLSLAGGATGTFLYSAYLFYYLRAGRYTATLKYISIIFDILLISIVIWSFGTYRTFKNEGYFIYFIWISMSAMRFSPRLTLLAGVLTVSLYMCIIAYAMVFNTIELGTLTESYTTHKVSIAALTMRGIFTTVCFLVLFHVGRLNRGLLNSLIESESKFRGLVEKSLVGVYIFQDNKFSYVNPTFARIFGYSQQEMINRMGLEELVSHEEKERLESAISSQLSGSSTKLYSLHAKHKYGHSINIETIGARTEYRGSPAIIGTLSDITARLKAQESVIEKAREVIRLQELTSRIKAISKLKSDFLASMSHELRTPLNAIIGLSRVLRDGTYGEMNDKQAEYAVGIIQSGEHLLSLINDILDLSKIEAGMEEPSMCAFSIADTLRSSLVLVKEKAAHHNIKLVSEIDPGVGIFYSDERRVKQILFNLLSNAMKFTEDGGTVGLRVEQVDGYLTISVWDTGIGIPKNKIPIIFEPFHQVDSSLSRRHEGTGLGLALTKKLVGLLGGAITVESEEGCGATFIVKLPIVDYRQHQAHPETRKAEDLPAPSLPDGAHFRGRRAMVVEDDSLSLSLVSDYLKHAGLEVMEISSGQEALDAISTTLPDIILLDIQMPGIDGLEVARRLKADKSTAGIPLVAITALAMKEDEKRCMDMGFDAYFRKPLHLDRLLYRVHELLEGEDNENQ